jgi:uncharacterized membrane protein
MHILKIFIACVFIIAGIMRFIYSNENKKERVLLYPFVPNGEYVIAILEIILALLLFTKYSKISLYTFALGIIVYTILVFYSQWYNVKRTIRNICTYQGTAKSVVLHITYLIIIIYLLMLQS